MPLANASVSTAGCWFSKAQSLVCLVTGDIGSSPLSVIQQLVQALQDITGHKLMCLGACQKGFH